MNLIKYDANLAVTSVTPVNIADLASLAGTVSLLVNNNPGVGSIYDPMYGTFSKPPRKRWITKLAFDNRFTMDEAVKLKQAQVMPARNVGETDADYATRSTVAAQLQVLDSRLKMASYIDLTRADTRGGVGMLQQIGLLTAARVAEILDGPITAAEYHPDA